MTSPCTAHGKDHETLVFLCPSLLDPPSHSTDSIKEYQRASKSAEQHKRRTQGAVVTCVKLVEDLLHHVFAWSWESLFLGQIERKSTEFLACAPANHAAHAPTDIHPTLLCLALCFPLFLHFGSHPETHPSPRLASSKSNRHAKENNMTLATTEQ